MSDDRPSQRTRQVRLEAIRKNLEWLESHDLDENPIDAAARIGLIKGDAQALVDAIGGEDGEEDARYRNPPTFYGVEGVPGIEGDDVE